MFFMLKILISKNCNKVLRGLSVPLSNLWTKITLCQYFPIQIEFLPFFFVKKRKILFVNILFSHTEIIKVSIYKYGFTNYVRTFG